MKTTQLFSLAALATSVLASGTTLNSMRFPLQYIKRSDADCAAAFGSGYKTCGSSGEYCYNPSAGETCCTDDEGYCPSGTYCAPFTGYCCHDGQSASDCASDNGLVYTGTATAGPSVTLTSSVGTKNGLATAITTDTSSYSTATAETTSTSASQTASSSSSSSSASASTLISGAATVTTSSGGVVLAAVIALFVSL